METKYYYHFKFPLKKRRKIWAEIEGEELPFETWWTNAEKAAAFPWNAELPEEQAMKLYNKFGGRIVKQTYDRRGYVQKTEYIGEMIA